MSSSSVKNSLDDSKEISKKVTVTVKEAKKTVIKEAKISEELNRKKRERNEKELVDDEQ